MNTIADILILGLGLSAVACWISNTVVGEVIGIEDLDSSNHDHGKFPNGHDYCIRPLTLAMAITAFQHNANEDDIGDSVIDDVTGDDADGEDNGYDNEDDDGVEEDEKKFLYSFAQCM